VTRWLARLLRRRAMSGETLSAIAPDAGVHPSHLSRVLSGRSWGHVETDGVPAGPGKRYVKKYSDEFIAEAVRRVKAGETMAQVARSCGIDSGHFSRIVRGQARRPVTREADHAES
jgi:DNA-binding phage protein